MIAAPEGTYGLFRPGRTLTVNSVYSKHWRTRQKAVATYRAEFADIIRRSPLPYLTVVGIEAIPYYKGGQIPDVGACLPAVKAAVDALVDTGRLPDDDRRYVRWLRFHAPEVGEWDGLLVAVRPLDEVGGGERGAPGTEPRVGVPDDRAVRAGDSGEHERDDSGDEQDDVPSEFHGDPDTQ